MNIDNGRLKYISRAILTLGMILIILPGYSAPVLKSGNEVQIPIPIVLISLAIAFAWIFDTLLHIEFDTKKHLWSETLVYIAGCFGGLLYFNIKRGFFAYCWLNIIGNGWNIHTTLSLISELFIYAPLLLILFDLFIRFIRPKKFMEAFPQILYLLTPALPHKKQENNEYWPVKTQVACITAGSLGSIIFATLLYKQKYFYQMTMAVIITTLKTANNSFSMDLVKQALPYVLLALAIITVIVFAVIKPKDSVVNLNDGKISGKKFKSWEIIFVYVAVLLVFPAAFLSDSVGFPRYVKLRFSPTTIYEDYYVDPAEVVTAPEHKKNLVFIVAESFENTLASVEEGGLQPTSYMSGLVELANEYTQFSHCDGLGGPITNTEAFSFTAGSVIGQTSGTSYMIESVPTGARCLEDILHDAGYVQMSVLGSHSTFAAFNTYVGRYDDSTIFDYDSALEYGYIPEDYCENWGFEDAKLFEWSKEFIGKMYDTGRPFYIMMRTADTHSSEGGHTCPDCRTDLPSGFLTAAECTSRRIYEFVEWLKQQPYWEDTIVVITGDHLIPTRVSGFVLDDSYTRSTYNCIINSDKVPVQRTNREFSAADMFPTVLSALGFEIEGNRCGLGTDLYSDRQTLPEEIGFEEFNKSLSSYSKWLNNASKVYVRTDKNFIIDLHR